MKGPQPAQAAAPEPIWCYRCGTARSDQLFARVGGLWPIVCATCWHLLGCPWPRNPPTMADVEEAEQRTRVRMIARGGTDRHLVRSGKA